MKIYMALFLLFFSSTVSSSGAEKFDKNKISNEVIESIEGLKNYGRFTFNFMFQRGPTSPFTIIEEKATIEELTELVNHPSPVVRCYAFSALRSYSSVDLLPIILSHLNDNEIVETTSFDEVGYDQKVGDIFIKLAINHYDMAYRDPIPEKALSPSQIELLNEALIYQPNELESLLFAIDQAKTSQYSYSKLRKVYLAENNQAALVVLAKYQKEQDVELILNNKEQQSYLSSSDAFTFQAMSVFSHSQFIPFLEQRLHDKFQKDPVSYKYDPQTYIAYKREQEWLIKAIIGYKNKQRMELLRKPLQNYRGQVHHRYIVKLYKKLDVLNAPLSDQLLWLFWSEQNILTVDVFNYLLTRNSKKAFELSQKTLLNADDYYLNFEWGKLADTMIDLVLEQDEELGVKIIRKAIPEVDINVLRVYGNKIAKIKDESFIIPLENRLKKTTNPFIDKIIMEALSAYGK